MAKLDPFRMAMALLSGEASAAWAARAGRVRSILVQILGPAAPSAPIVPPDVESSGQSVLRPTSPSRPAALQAAEDVLNALVRRRFGRLRDLCEETIWAQWPNGAIARHPRDALIEAYEARGGRPLAARVTDKRSYSFPELKSALARGVPEMLDTVFGARSGVTVCLALESPKGSHGRVMILVAPTADGGWRARNLPFSAPDDAHIASVRPSRLDNEIIKVPDQIVRKVVLGQGAQLNSMRNLLMPRFWLRDQFITVEKLAEVVGGGPPRLGSTETVFLGSEEISMQAATRHAPAAALDEIRRAAPNLFGRALDRMDPRLVLTRLGQLDPATGDVQPGQTATSVVLRIEESRQDSRRRCLAALFM